MIGTNNFTHLKDMLAKPELPEQARVIAEDLVMAIMSMQVSKETLPSFLELFEAIESSMVTNYLLQSLLSAETLESRKFSLF